jgi:two-component system sensor histidine kinase HydH
LHSPTELHVPKVRRIFFRQSLLLKSTVHSAPPIRRTLLIAFLLAGLLPAALVTGLAFFEARAVLKAEIERDMQTRAAAAAAEIDRIMFERMQNVMSWGRLEIMQEMLIGDVDKRLSNFLSELKASYPDEYAELYALDLNGTVIASSDPSHLGRHVVTHTVWLTTQLPQGKVRALALSADLLPLTAEIDGALGQGHSGTLYAVFDWQQVTRILAAASADSSAAELIDHDGRVLASTADWSEVIGAKARLTATAGANSFKRSPNFGWRVTLTQPETIAFAPVRRMGWVFLLLLGLTAALAALAAAPVAARIARPLGLLTGFARNFMREQHAATPPDTGPAEVRELSAAFAQMIADLERSRENLTRAAKLVVVGEMAAAMTHEVRTPLGILRSSAQLLLREPDLSTEGREVCGFIINETERLNRLVSALLDCARPRAPEFKPVDIGGLARQTAAMLAAQARKKNIEIDCAQTAGETFVECDEEQITQVLLNLLLNALQILPENGHIAVATRLDEENAVLEVADDGPGIPAALRERVFDPFFTQRAGGVGLGLVVVRQIVAAHGGEIGVFESKSGGALFHVRLPAHRKEEGTA